MYIRNSMGPYAQRPVRFESVRDRIYLCSLSHDPFIQNMIFIFCMPIPYTVTLKIKCYSPLQGKSLKWPCILYVSSSTGLSLVN